MPQLDNNTFIFQYLPFICTFIIMYITLSYLVLPIVLRILFLQQVFLNSGNLSAEIFNTIVSADKLTITIGLKTSLLSFRLRTVKMIHLVVGAVQYSHTKSNTNNPAVSLGFYNSYLDYLKLLILKNKKIK